MELERPKHGRKQGDQTVGYCSGPWRDGDGVDSGGEEQDGGELRGTPLLLCLVMLIVEARGVVTLYSICAV